MSEYFKIVKKSVSEYFKTNTCYDSISESYYQCTSDDNVLKTNSELEPSSLWSMGSMISNMEDIAKWFMYAGESELLNECRKDTSESKEIFATGRKGLYMCNGFFRNENFNILLHPGQIFGYDLAGAYHLGTCSSFGVVTNKAISKGNIRVFVLFPVLKILFGNISE